MQEVDGSEVIYLRKITYKLELECQLRYSDQGGYPYFYTGITQEGLNKGKTEEREEMIGKIAYK